MLHHTSNRLRVWWLCALTLVPMALPPAAGLRAADQPAPAGPAPAAAKPYPFTHCLVSGEVLAGDSVVSRVVDGQELKFINQGSLKKFLKDPDKYLEKFRRDLAQLQTKKSKP